MADGDFTSEGYEQITEYTASQLLSSGALNFTTAFTKDVKVNYVTFHKSASTTQVAKITIDALAGVNFDTEIMNETVTAAMDFIYKPDSPLVLKLGNQLKIEMTNTGAPAATVYVVVSTSSV